MKKRVRALSEAGKSQKEIGRMLKLSRGSVYRAQKKMGLCLPRYGRRSPELTQTQEAEILALLKSGRGTSWIGRELGCGEYQVRLVATKFNFRRRRGEVGYRYHLSDAKHAKIVAEIRARQNFARDIAWKYHVAYKIVLALAHEELRCPRFRGGYGEPLSSNFPQKHHDRNA
jgi:DNA-binding CsgD family transcriptional regulator